MECQAIAVPTPNPPHSQPPPPIPTIPYDILTLLIDSLRHDIHSLRACTLTARAWTHRARVHLHRSLTLEVDVRRCEFALPVEVRGSTEDFVFASEEDEEKFKTMGREVPVVLRYADELNLKCLQGGRSVRGRGAPLSTILPLFRHIRVLRITDADLSTISLSSLCHTQDANPSWAAAFPNLDSLSVSKTSFISAHNVLRFSLQFKRLRTLRVEDVTITGTSSSNDDDHASEFGCNSSFETPTIRNLHILNSSKSPTLASLLSTSLSHPSHSHLRKLHIDTTSHTSMLSALKNAEVESRIGIEELHLALTEELYPLWHVHAQGRVSNMTALDVRAAMKPVLELKSLKVLRLSVQRSPIVRVVQSMEGLGCGGGVLCSAWEVYREVFVGLFGKDERWEREDREGKEKFVCRELCLSFDARDIQGPRTHIKAFEETLLSSFSSSSSSPSSHSHSNPSNVQSKTNKVPAIKFLIKEFIDPVLPDEPARLRRLWGAFVERLRRQGRVEVGVEFFDRRDFDV